MDTFTGEKAAFCGFNVRSDDASNGGNEVRNSYIFTDHEMMGFRWINLWTSMTVALSSRYVAVTEVDC
ncbi:hypothetical protein SLE2022_096610 [Rubroshorea leprosula]